MLRTGSFGPASPKSLRSRIAAIGLYVLHFSRHVGRTGKQKATAVASQTDRAANATESMRTRVVRQNNLSEDDAIGYERVPMRWAVRADSHAVVHIASLARDETGLKCGCICPECDATLQAVNAGRPPAHTRPYVASYCNREGGRVGTGKDAARARRPSATELVRITNSDSTTLSRAVAVGMCRQRRFGLVSPSTATAHRRRWADHATGSGAHCRLGA